MKGLLYSLTVVSLLMGLAAPVSIAPALAAAKTTPSDKASIPSVKTGWEKDWAKILADAKKEGTVNIYCTGWGPATQRVLIDAFRNKYEIGLEFTIFGRGAELVARIQRENSAGLNVVDIIGTGSGTLLPLMKPQGLLGNIGNLLILPEVTDTRMWGGKIPFLDKDMTSIGMIANTQRYIAYNTDLVKKGEITSYKDLLKPVYKGKIILNDPTISGGGNVLFGFLSLNAWNPKEAQDYLRQLLTQQDAVVSRDIRLIVETVARGKYALALGPDAYTVKEFLKVGAPIDVPVLQEGTGVAATNGTFGISVTLSHPNAAKVFINWLLSKEGQTIFSQNQGNPSVRIDVPVEGMFPQLLPQPGEKLYFNENEEMVLFRGAEMTTALSQIILQARK